MLIWQLWQYRRTNQLNDSQSLIPVIEMNVFLGPGVVRQQQKGPVDNTKGKR